MGLVMYRSRGSHQGTRASEDRVCKVSSDEPTVAVLLEMLCRRIKELLASVDYLAQGLLWVARDARHSIPWLGPHQLH